MTPNSERPMQSDLYQRHKNEKRNNLCLMGQLGNLRKLLHRPQKEQMTAFPSRKEQDFTCTLLGVEKMTSRKNLPVLSSQ